MAARFHPSPHPQSVLFPERQKGNEEIGYLALSYGGEGYRVNIKMLFPTRFLGKETKIFFHPPAGEGVGESEFGRLEKKPSTLLCGVRSDMREL
jgi:hypothetical protein